MLILRIVVWILSVGLMVPGAGVAFGQATSTGSGQAYPNKPIRVVASEVGGAADLIARLIAQGLSGLLGQQVIVDNRPGGVIPGEIVSRAPPDGYTLLVAGNTFWTGPLMQKKAPYDPVTDFAPISMVSRQPNVLVVNPVVPVKSVKELIALAKTKPGELNYGTAGTGSSGHLAGELFKAMTGVNIVRIAYKGSGPALNDLLGGVNHA